MANSPTPRRPSVHRAVFRDVGIAVAVVAVALLLVAPGLDGDPTSLSRSQVLGTLGITVIAALGLNLLAGYAGQLSLGQGAFIALGAYLSAWLHLDMGLPWGLAMAGAVALSAAIGVLLALAAARLQGPQVAMVTLAFAVVIQRLFNDATAFGRLAGYPNTPQHGSTLLDPMAVGSVRFEPPIFAGVAPLIMVVIAVAVAVSFLAYRNLVRSGWGRSLKAIRESELVASHFGIDTTRRKLSAWAVAAVYGAVAGVLTTQLTAHLQPESFTFLLSINLIVLIILGGSGLLLGPIVGAVALRWFEESDLIDGLVVWQQNTISEQWYLSEPGVVGLVLILTLAVMPRGMVGGAKAGLARFRRQREGDGTDDSADSAESTRPPLRRLAEHDVPRDEEIVLTVEGVSHAFGRNQAVDEMRLEARAGRIHALIGPNGAGKTTLVNVISGVYPLQRGTINLGGVSTAGLSAPDIHRLGVCRTFQTPQLFGSEDGVENVLAGMASQLDEPFWASVVRTPRIYREEARARERAEQLLAFVGLGDRMSTVAEELPYGLQRALELARALAGEPRLLILDEPAAGLNPEESQQLGRVLQAITDAGVAVLIVEHDMELVTAIADEVTCMGDQGKLLYHGDAAGLHQDERVLAAYLGSPAEPPAPTEGA